MLRDALWRLLLSFASPQMTQAGAFRAAITVMRAAEPLFACRGGWAFQNLETMPDQGSTGNVIAALCSFFLPGLGQLLQGRLLKALIFLCLAGLLWPLLLGWLIHIWAAYDAAVFAGRP